MFTAILLALAVQTSAAPAVVPENPTPKEVLRAACVGGHCTLKCRNTNDPNLTLETMFRGHFSDASADEILVMLHPCDDSSMSLSWGAIILLRRTPKGWRPVLRDDHGIYKERECHPVPVRGRHILLCHTGRIGGGYVETLATLAVLSDQLKVVNLLSTFDGTGSSQCANGFAWKADIRQWQSVGNPNGQLRAHLELDILSTPLPKKVATLDVDSEEYDEACFDAWSRLSDVTRTRKKDAAVRSQRRTLDVPLDEGGLVISPSFKETIRTWATDAVVYYSGEVELSGEEVRAP